MLDSIDNWPKLPPMTGEIRQHGGYAVYELYGAEYMAQIGAIGGEETVERHGREYMREIGRRGGLAKLAKYGKEAYSAMGRAKRKKRKKRIGTGEPRKRIA